MEITSIENVRAELKNKGAHTVSPPGAWFPRGDDLEYYNIEWTTIDDNDVIRDHKARITRENTADEGEEPVYKYRWVDRVPGILRDPVTTPELRPFHYSMTDLIVEIKKSYSFVDDNNAERDINVSRNGDYDDVFAQVVDDKGDIVDARFRAFDKGSGPELKEVK